MPADDMTDPAVGAILAHLDTTVILSRAQAAKGIYPAVDPLASGSRLMDRGFFGDRHYRVAQTVREHLARYQRARGHHRHARHRGAVRGRPAHRAARAPAAALSHPAVPCRGRQTRHCRAYRVPLAQTLTDCEAFLRGDYDDMPEERCYMRGAMGEPAHEHLHRASAERGDCYERIDDVSSFVGEDDSGSFGLLARHDRFMTVLDFGLARLPLAGR